MYIVVVNKSIDYKESSGNRRLIENTNILNRKNSSKHGSTSKAHGQSQLPGLLWPFIAQVGFTQLEVWAAYSPVKNHPDEARAKFESGNPTHRCATHPHERACVGGIIAGWRVSWDVNSLWWRCTAPPAGSWTCTLPTVGRSAYWAPTSRSRSSGPSTG
jgi:hypothetical protein